VISEESESNLTLHEEVKGRICERLSKFISEKEKISGKQEDAWAKKRKPRGKILFIPVRPIVSTDKRRNGAKAS